MVQVAAALLFAVAAGLSLIVILAMLKINEDAILSALLGQGAFPAADAPQQRPSPQASMARRASAHREARRPVRAVIRPLVSRAA